MAHRRRRARERQTGVEDHHPTISVPGAGQHFMMDIITRKRNERKDQKELWAGFLNGTRLRLFDLDVSAMRLGSLSVSLSLSPGILFSLRQSLWLL